jgi:hypothetical protein
LDLFAVLSQGFLVPPSGNQRDNVFAVAR